MCLISSPVYDTLFYNKILSFLDVFFSPFFTRSFSCSFPSFPIIFLYTSTSSFRDQRDRHRNHRSVYTGVCDQGLCARIGPVTIVDFFSTGSPSRPIFITTSKSSFFSKYFFLRSTSFAHLSTAVFIFEFERQRICPHFGIDFG